MCLKCYYKGVKNLKVCKVESYNKLRWIYYYRKYTFIDLVDSEYTEFIESTLVYTDVAGLPFTHHATHWPRVTSSPASSIHSVPYISAAS